MEERWVFGYGSLMWRPGFVFEEEHPARLRGAHRSLCVYSHVHRGTAERPGLVLGLDRGGSCRGVAFRIAPQRWDETLAYLRAREQATSVYVEATRPVTLLGAASRVVPALCYLVDRRHPQYAGALTLDTQFDLVSQGEGRSGRNVDYVLATVEHLAELGVDDPELRALAERLLASRRQDSERVSPLPPRVRSGRRP
ncbi:MAG: gamma-glutamylcyclotransferase [Pseudomonadota bacterium]|nr:gamma-glutamylcyclotransferase [Pseudomonadota bacterium]